MAHITVEAAFVVLALAAPPVLLGCHSPEGNREALEAGWHGVDQEGPPGPGAEVVRTLRRAQEELYHQGRAESLWVDSLCYVGWAWTEAEKARWRHWVAGYPTVDLQWRDVEFTEERDFARVRVRGVTAGSRSPGREDLYFEGTCFLRKFEAGWKFRLPFPNAIQQGDGTWEKCIMDDVLVAVEAAKSSQKAQMPVPSWAANEEIIRVLQESLALYRQNRQFPMLDMLYFMLSDNLAVRRFVHDFVARTFEVDFGYSEEPASAKKPGETSWFKGWQDWAHRTFPRSQELVPWP
jgi:hypothetical protein